MISLVSSLEILIVNLIINELATTKKIKKLYHYGVIIFHTILVFAIFFFFIPKNSPTYLSLIIAWSYLVPFLFIYKEKMIIIVITMSFALSHTLFVNGLSYHILTILTGSNQNWYFVLLQTIILSITTPLMIFFINKRIKYILRVLNERTVHTVLLISLAAFTTTLTLRFFINIETFSSLVLIYSAIFILLIYSYFLAYKIIYTKKDLDHLSTLVYEDSLTKIKNRLALYRDFQLIILEQKNCYLFFLDLDDLKKINDTHGHLIGDQYIVAFTETVKKCLDSNQEFYRISGDEFVIIDFINDKECLTSLDIKQAIKANYNYEIDFIGVSIGQSKYPEESLNLDDLLNLADQKMYEDKKNNLLPR